MRVWKRPHKQSSTCITKETEVRMSVEVYQRQLNTIDQDIARLESRMAEQSRIEVDCQSHIVQIERAMQHIHSASSYQSGIRQINSYQSRMNDALKRRADLNLQLARKRTDRTRVSGYLQRAFAAEAKQQRRSQDALMRSYQRKISELEKALTQSVREQIQSTTVYSEVEAMAAEHDVFISHATEDKESFVNELVEELKKRKVKVWVDDLKIKWGDPLRKSIDEGLNKSRFGIVVISKHFIAKGWTQYELDGLFEKEMSGGKVILPIWHEITKKEVQAFSPALAGRKAMTTASMTPADIADELVLLLGEGK